MHSVPEGAARLEIEGSPMGELGLNKIFGALLALALVVMGLREVSMIVFGGGHHHHKEYESLNAWAESNFKGYRVNIAEVGGAGEVIEEIYDLGALLLGADLARGERSFKAKCASCHTIEQGGSNGTGPNLYATMGAAKQSHSSFSYSGALNNTDGDWSWENMDAWLENPGSYARGTSMAFAGLKRDDERASVLAYLASYSPDAPAQPEPLPEVTEEGDAEEAAGDLSETDETVIDGGEASAAEDAAIEAEAAADQAIEEAADAGAGAIAEATEAAVSVVETVTDATDEAADEVTEAVETVTDIVEEETTPEE
ncbi:MAG: c-type cytochrome [Henriciella sp.]|nr:c-type cytochrome [Henriciella sp.]